MHTSYLVRHLTYFKYVLFQNNKQLTSVIQNNEKIREFVSILIEYKPAIHNMV